MSVQFASKARTLANLRSLLKSAKIADLLYFSVAEWQQNSHEILQKISSKFATPLIIRSSCAAEDNHKTSNAGAFLSLLNIDAKNQNAISQAILQVINSYGENALASDEVLVQPMLQRVKFSGVAFSHDPNTCSPYRIISWQDGEDTTAVTAGNSQIQTIQIAAETNAKNFSGNLVENENEIVKKHFVAVSTNIEATQKFGIPPENVFEFWDWVGGRFSLWSAIGLPILLAVGKKHFADFLAGANDMDEHFIHSDLDKNLPLTLALLSVWNTNFLNAPSFAVFPYSQSLTRFPRYLQQLEMESNGKTVDRNAQIVDFATSPIVWGTAGTNGQHSYFQLLHQGGQIVASDFICVKKSDFPEFITDSKNKNSQHLQQHQNILLANCLAQSAALAFGQTADEAKKYGISDDLLAYRTFKGNQPSTTLILPELTPFVLGQLLALYEHKVFCLGVLWNLNSFDQWGVELGKHLAGKILPFFKDKNNTKNDEVFNNLDSSTQLLLDSLLKC